MAFYENRIVAMIVRIIQVILAILILGLTCYVGNWWVQYWHAAAPSQVNFLLFCSVWCLLALIYLVVVPWRFAHTAAGSQFAILGAEILTMLFWFAGFIALAVFLSDRVCFGHVCNAAKAAAAFGAFEWLMFAFSTAYATLQVLRNRGSTSPYNSDPKLNMAEGV